MNIIIKNIEWLRRTGPHASELLGQIKKEKKSRRDDIIVTNEKKE